MNILGERDSSSQFNYESDSDTDDPILDLHASDGQLQSIGISRPPRGTPVPAGLKQRHLDPPQRYNWQEDYERKTFGQFYRLAYDPLAEKKRQWYSHFNLYQKYQGVHEPYYQYYLGELNKYNAVKHKAPKYDGLPSIQKFMLAVAQYAFAKDEKGERWEGKKGQRWITRNPPVLGAVIGCISGLVILFIALTVIMAFFPALATVAIPTWAAWAIVGGFAAAITLGGLVGYYGTKCWIDNSLTDTLAVPVGRALGKAFAPIINPIKSLLYGKGYEETGKFDSLKDDINPITQTPSIRLSSSNEDINHTSTIMQSNNLVEEENNFSENNLT